MAIYRRKKGSKYKNIKVEYDGINFDSKKERDRYVELKTLYNYGKIRELKVQPRFTLMKSFMKDGKRVRPIEYVADFMYKDIETGKYIVEDVKSEATKTDVYKIKKKLFHRIFKNLTIVEI